MKSKIRAQSQCQHLQEGRRPWVHWYWWIFQRILWLDSKDIQKLLKDLQCESEQVNDRIICMSMYNDIVWWEQGTTEKCEYNSLTVANYARRFPRGRWSFLRPGSEKKWYETYSDKPDGDWEKTAEQMMLNLAESSHPIFRATSVLDRGKLRSKGEGKKSIHFNGSEENIELILRTIISANQHSIYGAVADLCKELSKDSRASGTLDANEYFETMEIPTETAIVDHTDGELQGNLLQNCERKFEQLSDDQKLSKQCSDAGWKIVEKGEFFITLDAEEGPNEMKNLCREYTLPRSAEASSDRSWMWRSVFIKNVMVLKSWSNLCFETGQLLGLQSWTESTSMSPKRQKPYALKTSSKELQGDLLRRQSHNQSLLWHCFPCLFLYVKENE